MEGLSFKKIGAYFVSSFIQLVITLLSCFFAQSLHLNHDYRADFGHNDGQGEDQQRGEDA